MFTVNTVNPASFYSFFQDNEFLSVRFTALSKDAMNSSHPVSAKVTAPEEVEEMFDSVSYEKVAYSEHISFCVLRATNWKLTRTLSLVYVFTQGASLLLMLNASLDKDMFKKGVIKYLKKFNGSNTEKEDLWNSFSQVQPSSSKSMKNC